MTRTAAHFERLSENKVLCTLCPAECVLTPGKRGICDCRFNQDGTLVTDNYGELVTIALDPIEKKPLYHFYPGSMILSTGPNCCNLGCLHCQNWSISQEKVATMHYSPGDLVAAALNCHSLGVAFTYTEPMIWFEFIMDTAPLLRAKDMKVVLVTNGFINPAPLEELIRVTDAMNIDLKSIRPEFYTRICKGKLEPVLETIRRVAASSVHLELTNLIIPEENDAEAELRGVVDFVASLSDRIPLHFSAYHPDYQLQREATPLATLQRAFELAVGKLKYVYLGNLATATGRDTFCPSCKNLLIARRGFDASIVGLTGDRCRGCGSETDIRV